MWYYQIAIKVKTHVGPNFLFFTMISLVLDLYIMVVIKFTMATKDHYTQYKRIYSNCIKPSQTFTQNKKTT
jgi:hypothetical protein